MILSTLDKSRKGGAYEQIPSLVLGQRWTPQLNSRNMMKVVLCVWIEPYIENDLSFCVWPVHTPTTSKEVLTLSASTSPLPYTGNKSCIVNTILSVMPKHTVYIDPCMGSAEVFFRKPRAEKEILNDYNGDLVNLFRVIQNNEKLAYLLGRLYLSINGELAFKQNKDVVSDVFDDEQLGRFYAGNGFMPEYETLPDKIYEHLDFAKIGREARESEGGVFTQRGYRRCTWTSHG